MSEDEVFAMVTAFAEKVMETIDTAALSIWVDHIWFIEHGGQILAKD